MKLKMKRPNVLSMVLFALQLSLSPVSAEAGGPMKPEDINEKFAAAFNSGKIENVLGLYEKSGAVVSAPNKVDHGLREIEKALSPLLASGGKMTSVNVSATTVGDIALLRADWKINGAKKPDGSPLEISGKSIEVVRKQRDGRWLYVIDQPFGN